MLGYHPLLGRELRKSGRRAFAKVLEADRGKFATSTGNLAAEQIATTKVHWTLVLSVEPEGEPAFQAKIDAMLGLDHNPAAGDEIPVLYDPKDHQKVLLDQSDEAEGLATDRRITAGDEGRIARMRARGQNDVADRYQAVVDAGLTTKWSNDPAKMREQIHERQAKIKEIMGGQNVLIGGNVVAGAAGGPATAGAASGVATADALTKLAALRDRGLLTDEEFEAQKKRLLGE